MAKRSQPPSPAPVVEEPASPASVPPACVEFLVGAEGVTSIAHASNVYPVINNRVSLPIGELRQPWVLDLLDGLLVPLPPGATE